MTATDMNCSFKAIGIEKEMERFGSSQRQKNPAIYMLLGLNMLPVW